MEQKYYIGLGTKDAERGWIYKGTGIETDNSIDLIEEFTMAGSTSSYEKDGVVEITKEDYDSIASELELEDPNYNFIDERIDEIFEAIEGK